MVILLPTNVNEANPPVVDSCNALIYRSNFMQIFSLPKKNIHNNCLYTAKKEESNFHHKEGNSEWAVAKSYMTNGLLICGEIIAHFLKY
jgi:hypothetical protein